MRPFGLRVLLLVLVLALGLPGRVALALEVQRVVSSGGIEAWLVEDHTVPVFALSVDFRAGTTLDPAGKEGVASLATATMTQAAGDLDNEAFQGRLADLSVSLGFGAGRDNVTGTLRSLSVNRDAAFELLALALSRPRFDAADVERVRAATLTSLARQATDPSSVALRAFYRVVFEGHPYARTPQGSEATVATITPEDLGRFVATQLSRDRIIVSVAGAIAATDLGPLLDRTFAPLPAKAAALDASQPSPPAREAIIVVRMAVPQSVVVFGQNGIKRDDPDWYAATVLNYVLGGGGFNSRLTHEVRERRGLAYGISTSLQPLDQAGLIVGWVATRNARVAETIAVVKREWVRLAETGISDAELADAKTYMTGSFPLQLDSTAAIAGLLLAMQRHNLGIDHLARRDDLINGVTADDVRRVAKRLLDSDRLSVVVVGEPSDVTSTRVLPAEPG
ncbi:MAG: insulinase family protein [Alphaproteobacteria bacterium]|nr:insulinase family protein [Alphaproteobacteria bacterium]